MAEMKFTLDGKEYLVRDVDVDEASAEMSFGNYNIKVPVEKFEEVDTKDPEVEAKVAEVIEAKEMKAEAVRVEAARMEAEAMEAVEEIKE